MAETTAVDFTVDGGPTSSHRSAPATGNSATRTPQRVTSEGE